MFSSSRQQGAPVPGPVLWGLIGLQPPRVPLARNDLRGILVLSCMRLSLKLLLLYILKVIER